MSDRLMKKQLRGELPIVPIGEMLKEHRGFEDDGHDRMGRQMTALELRDSIIADAIESVNKHETRPERIRGCLTGLELCRTLETPDQYLALLEERHDEEMQLRKLRVDPKNTGNTAAPPARSNSCGNT